MIKNVEYGLAGIALTPPGVSVSEADNLIWLLGKYIERRNRESGPEFPYVID